MHKKRTENCTGHIWHTNLLKYITEGKIEGRIEVAERRGRRRKQLLDDFKETERGSTRSHSLKNSLSKRLWTCRKTYYGMNKFMN
jgi:hypothetical protein